MQNYTRVRLEWTQGKINVGPSKGKILELNFYSYFKFLVNAEMRQLISNSNFRELSPFSHIFAIFREK